MELLPVTARRVERGVEEALFLHRAMLEVTPRDVPEESSGAPRSGVQDLGEGAATAQHVRGHATPKGVPPRGQTDVGTQTAKSGPYLPSTPHGREEERFARGPPLTLMLAHLGVESVDATEELSRTRGAVASTSAMNDLAEAGVLSRVEADGRAEAPRRALEGHDRVPAGVLGIEVPAPIQLKREELVLYPREPGTSHGEQPAHHDEIELAGTADETQDVILQVPGAGWE